MERRSIRIPCGGGDERRNGRIVQPEQVNSSGRAASGEQTLGAVMARRRLSFSEIGRIGAKAADALARGHEQGDPHGAVSPDCVMLDREGRSRLVGPASRRPDQPYLSPEQVRGERPGPASDVYALGLVLLEAATGRQVYPGTTPAAAQTRLYNQPMVPNEVPGPLARVLLAMTETDPAARPDARRSADMLDAVSAAEPPVGAAVSGAGYGRVAVLGLPVLVLLVLVGALLYVRSGGGASTAPDSASSSASAPASVTPTESDRPSATATEPPSATPTPTPTPSRSSSARRPSLPTIALPTGLPKIDKPTLPDLPSSSSITEKADRAWHQFTHWLSGLFPSH